MSATRYPLIIEQDGTWHQTGQKNAIGATVRVTAGTYPNCPGGTCDPCSAQAFDALVGRTLARRVQKVYLEPGVLPATPPAAWQQFTAAGGRLLISFRPSPAPTPAGDAAFRTCVTGCFGALTPGGWKAVLWQEPNTSKSGFTAAQYHDYSAHYAPILRDLAPLVPVVYDPIVGAPADRGSPQSALDFMPHPGDFDEVAADFYCTAYLRGGRLDDLSAAASMLGKPFGCAEIGPNASPWAFNATQWEGYIAYLLALFTGRLAAGHDNGWIIWWAGNVGSGPNADWITTPGDPKIPGLQRLVDQLAS